MTTTLVFCKNMFGTIKPDIQKRLQAVIDNPNQDTWDDTYSIIIDRWTTLWQAVLEVDPTYQRRASIDESTYKTRWDSIPTSETIIKAIQNKVFKISLN